MIECNLHYFSPLFQLNIATFVKDCQAETHCLSEELSRQKNNLPKPQAHEAFIHIYFKESRTIIAFCVPENIVLDKNEDGLPHGPRLQLSVSNDLRQRKSTTSEESRNYPLYRRCFSFIFILIRATYCSWRSKMCVDDFSA